MTFARLTDFPLNQLSQHRRALNRCTSGMYHSNLLRFSFPSTENEAFQYVLAFD